MSSKHYVKPPVTSVSEVIDVISLETVVTGLITGATPVQPCEMTLTAELHQARR